jgi:hypothetical protein
VDRNDRLRLRAMARLSRSGDELRFTSPRGELSG